MLCIVASRWNNNQLLLALGQTCIGIRSLIESGNFAHDEIVQPWIETG